jgi:RNA polymerase sigma-70 factor, ECF subfamily
MARYVDGDAQAFEELFRRYERVVYGFLTTSTPSSDRVEDLYQELFLRVHRARTSYDPSRPFKAWLFQIARRLVIDDAQRAFRGQELQIHGWEPAEQKAGVEERIASRECLREALDMLSDDERYAVVAVRVEGIGYAELAKRLHKSADTVKKTVSRALLRLRNAAPFDGTPDRATAVTPVRRPSFR